MIFFKKPEVLEVFVLGLASKVAFSILIGRTGRRGDWSPWGIIFGSEGTLNAIKFAEQACKLIRQKVA